MDNLIPEAYRKYGQYVNRFRSFPQFNDGLKPVERRLLLTAHLIARDKNVKSARVTGTCMARFHPHADSYGTLALLVNQGFLDGQGNFGNNLGVDPSPPAASRYTECRISKFTEQIAFELIKYVDWIEGEMDENEPSHLPTMFPFCLIGQDYTQGIGFGFKTLIPCYTLDDLKTRLLWLLNPDENEPIIAPISDCTITSSNVELKQLLVTGKAKLEVEGRISIDKRNCKVTVHSWPLGKKFETILNKKNIKAHLDNADVGFMDLSSGDNGTAIVFSVLKTRNRDKIFKTFLTSLKKELKGSISFDSITSDRQGNVQLTSIDSMLANTHALYVEANKRMLNSKIQKNNDLIKEYNLIDMLRPYITRELGHKIYDMEKAVININAASSVDPEAIKEILTKYRISKLFTLDTDTGELQTKNTDLQSILNSIGVYVLDKYTNL